MGGAVHHQLDGIVRFDEAGPVKTVFMESETLKAQVMGLEAGRQIPPCAMTRDVVFVILEGEGEVVANGDRFPVRPFSWILVPKETKTRSIEASTRMTILAMQTG